MSMGHSKGNRPTPQAAVQPFVIQRQRSMGWKEPWNKRDTHDVHPMLQPFDEYNQTLERNARRLYWTPPQPAARYHLVAIGAGTAGPVTAAGAAGLGAEAAPSSGDDGGDCLNRRLP